METIILSLTLTTLLGCIFGAPISQSKIDELTEVLKSQVKDQEQALVSLGALQNQVNAAQSLGISKSKSVSYSNVNGDVQQEETQEQKVTDPEADNVISDARQHVQQSQSSPDFEPETSFDASLDVPAVGIHKEVSSNDEQRPEAALNMQSEAFKDTIEFTPEIVAQYLYDNEAKNDFLNLLNELVETSEITSEEAEKYERSVMDALYKMEKAAEKRNGNEPTVESLFPQGYGDPQQPLYPTFNEQQAAPEELYPLYGGYGQGQDNVQNYVNYVLNKPVTLDDMINNLLDEWLTKAVVTGDPEAEEILTNIVDYVSRDNNPNDEEQVKAVLGDIFAEALLEDLTPRIQPQEFKDVNILPASIPEVLEPVQQLPVESESVESDAEQELSKEEVAKTEEIPEAASSEADMEEPAKMK